MKIIFLVRWLPPKIDGVGDYTWNLAQALRKLGIDVYIFTSEEPGCKDLVKNDWVFPIIKEWQPKAVVRALETARVDAPDWLCFQYVPQMYGRGCIAWQAAETLKELKKQFKCKLAVTFHEFVADWSLNPKQLFLASLTRLQTRRMLSVIDFGITTCARYKEALRNLSGHNLPIDVIPVGSNIEPIFINSEELIALRNKIFPEQAKVFGLFSRLSTFRNFPLAVRALQRARYEGLDAWLYIIGSAEASNPKLFKDLMQLAEKLGVKPYVVASGELSKEDLSAQLKILDVFIFPQTDGISTRNTALMAALACGLPVVSFKPYPGNFDDFCIPCGVLVDRGNEEAFIQVVMGCLKNCDNLSETRQANSDYYYQHFSWPIIAKRYIEALGA